MKVGLILCAVFVLVGSSVDAFARRLVKRICVTEPDTSRSCTYYYDDGREVKRTDRRITGIPYKRYIRGLQQGKCLLPPECLAFAEASERAETIGTQESVVCTENLNPHVMVMKPAKDCVSVY